jgi:hypothetical protein
VVYGACCCGTGHDCGAAYAGDEIALSTITDPPVLVITQPIIYGYINFIVNANTEKLKPSAAGPIYLLVKGPLKNRARTGFLPTLPCVDWEPQIHR